MKLNLAAGAAAMAMLFAGAASATNVVMTFGTAPSDDIGTGPLVGSSYTESNFVLTSSRSDLSATEGFGSLASFAPNPAAGGSSRALYNAATAQDGNGNRGLTTLARVGLGTFDFLGIDLSLLAAPTGEGAYDVSVTFTGKNGTATVGTYVAQILYAEVDSNGDQIVDGFGFQTFPVTGLTGLTGLTSLEWEQTGKSHQFDNIVVRESTVTTPPNGAPEPGSLALAGLALAGLAAARRARR